MEGDTPSFLGLIPNGLNNLNYPNWGSWGGRYELYTPRFQKWFYQPEIRPLWSNASDEVLGHDGRWHTQIHATVWRWREAFQNDFVARMDWTINSYDAANHPPKVELGHARKLSAKPGERVNLIAANVTDPDGDAVSYEWFYYPEPGTLAVSAARTGQPLKINNFDQSTAWFMVPTTRVLRYGSMHIILAVTDHGTPRLTRYQRVIVTVE